MWAAYNYDAERKVILLSRVRYFTIPMGAEMKEKLLSGRFFLTVMCGIVFAYCSIRGKLSLEAVASIVTMVFQAYFTRPDRKTENGGQK